MRKNLLTVLSAIRINKGPVDAEPNKSAPIELDMSVLKHVAGGLAPRGTWGSEAPADAATVEAPRGTWL